MLLMRSMLSAAAAVFLLAGSAAAVPALAADDAPKADAGKPADKDKIDLPPFPADATVKQVTHVAGKTLNYTATVGSLPVRDEKGKKIAEVVFTAYVLDGPRDPKRPITFAFNGGPGAASVYLNLGALGPKRLQFGLRSGRAGGQSRHLDGFHRHGVHRSRRHRLFPQPRGRGRDQEGLLPGQAGHRLPVAGRVRLAPEEQSDGLAEVRGG
jgi:hypothetical protein